MAHTKGLHFKKVDLHVHTWASSDYEGTKPTATEIVDRALERGLAAIAITDHQTASAVDEVKAAARGRGLVVFPGVELMVAGGERGVHINLLFDVDKDTNHIHQFLNTLKVYTKDGKPAVLAAEVTVGKVAEELAVYDPTAIVVLAHCHSSKGVTGDIKGETRTQIFQTHRKNILAAEANESDFLSDEKKKDHRRVIDVFDGSDKDYFFRKLGVIQASDAHSLAALGSAYAWIKIDEPITIEDLRQSFIDRDTRIRQSFEFNLPLYPRIESLVITSGFLKDQEFSFHDGLNSLLGAKGSGKSLAVEALRFALGQAPTVSPIKDDHDSKLAKQVKPYGTVVVVIVDESGKRYRIIRTYSPSDGNPTEIVDMADASKKQFSPSEVFPVLFLSQNEIIRIAEDPTGSSLRTFIDRFFDFHHHQHHIDLITKELSAADRAVAEALRAHLSLAESKGKAATLKEEIEKLNRQLTNSTFERFSTAEAVGRGIRLYLDFITEMETETDALGQQSKERQLPVADPGAANDPSVKRAAAASGSAIDTVRRSIQQLREALKPHKLAAQEEYKTWEGQFAPVKAEYEKLVKDAGGNQGALDQRRRKLTADLTAVERQISVGTGKAQGLRQAFENRNAILNRLDDAYRAYFQERRERCKFFTEQSHGAIEVTVAEGRDVSQFKDKLLGIKKGTYVREEEIEHLATVLTPRELVGLALRFEYGGKQDKKPIEELAQSKNLRVDVLERLITHMLSEMRYEELLGLMYETAPQDVPEIAYEVGGLKKPLSELSVGQKAAALLIVGLSDGHFPIVIDQPEDSLDLRSIWTDVCNTLRGAKDTRQFIFTTHNSSVAVASDSDKFTILQAEATHATILHSGSINSPEIRKQVIAYLEGGPDTYEKKRAKYNVEGNSRDKH